MVVEKRQGTLIIERSLRIISWFILALSISGCSIQTRQQQLDEQSELLRLRSENSELFERSQRSELTATQLNEILLNLPRSSECVQVSTNKEGVVNAAAINCALCPCNI